MNMMTNVTTTKPMMTSKEISDLLGSRHDKVKQSIERLASRGVIELPPLREVVNKQALSANNKAKVYIFEGEGGKRDSYVVVAQLSPEFTARLVDRWQELENQHYPQLPNFNDPVAAARAWADAKEAEQQALAQLESAKPAVAFVEKYVTTTGNKGFRAVAKLLGVKENVFRNFLSREKIQYKLGGEWFPYAQHINLNRFVVKTGATENYTYNQALFTPKGVEWIADKWNKCKHRYGY